MTNYRIWINAKIKIRDQQGMIENIFVLLIILFALLTTGSVANAALTAQRYKYGLDLTVRNTVRDLVLNHNLGSAQTVAETELESSFASMGLSESNTHITASESPGRCGAIKVTASKQIYPLWIDQFSITVSADQSEPQDPLSSGLMGTATCIG